MKKILALTLVVIMLSSLAMAEGEPTKEVIADTGVEVSAPVAKKQFTEADKEAFKQKMQERKLQFAKRLNLTEEQQKQADELHQKSKEQMKAIKAEMKALKEKADTLREQNKKDFEALLTEEQKATLEKIHQEHKERFEKKGPRHGKKGRPHHKKGGHHRPAQDK